MSETKGDMDGITKRSTMGDHNLDGGIEIHSIGRSHTVAFSKFPASRKCGCKPDNSSSSAARPSMDGASSTIAYSWPCNPDTDYSNLPSVYRIDNLHVGYKTSKKATNCLRYFPCETVEIKKALAEFFYLASFVSAILFIVWFA